MSDIERVLVPPAFICANCGAPSKDVNVDGVDTGPTQGAAMSAARITK